MRLRRVAECPRAVWRQAPESNSAAAGGGGVEDLCFFHHCWEASDTYISESQHEHLA